MGITAEGDVRRISMDVRGRFGWHEGTAKVELKLAGVVDCDSVGLILTCASG